MMKFIASFLLYMLFCSIHKIAYLMKIASLVQFVRDSAWRARLKSLGTGARIHAHVTIHHPANVSIGERSSLAGFVHIWGGGGIEIGDDVLIASHVAVTSMTHDTDSEIYRDTLVCAPVIIENNVWIGASAVVLPGVRIGAGAIVGAGAVVTRDVPPGSVMVGVPARLMRYRTQQAATGAA